MKQLSQVEIGRMRALASYLESSAVDPDRFYLDSWQEQAEQPAKTKWFGLVEVQPACGFAGCAMGWAAHAQLFDGLWMTKQGYVVYKGQTDMVAAATVMGVTIGRAAFLFHPQWYKAGNDASPGMVAQRLRRFADKVESRLARARSRDLTNVIAELSRPRLTLVA